MLIGTFALAFFQNIHFIDSNYMKTNCLDSAGSFISSATEYSMPNTVLVARDAAALLECAFR